MECWIDEWLNGWLAVNHLATCLITWFLTIAGMNGKQSFPPPSVTMQSIVPGNSLRSRISRDRNAIGDALLPGEGVVKDYVIVHHLTI